MAGSRKPSTSASLQRTGSRKSRSNTGKRSSSGLSSISEISHLTVDQEIVAIKPINYREELTFLFFNTMLTDLVQQRQKLLSSDVENVSLHTLDHTSDKMPKDFSISAQEVDVKRDFKNVLEEDLMERSILSVQGSTVMLGKKGSKKSKSSAPGGRKRLTAPRKSKRDMSFVSSRQENIKSIMAMSTESAKIGTSDEVLKTVDDTFNWIVIVEDSIEKITFTNGNVYEGPTSKGLMHGNGIFYWTDGTVYQGEFRDGFPTGKGKIVLPDLSHYEGDFCRGFFHGEGMYNIPATPIIYSGEWRSGKKSGKGWLLYGANNWYDGEWLNDLKHGLGHRQYKNGARYKGHWSENVKHGHGRMIWENNDYYVGEWCNDLPHGYGEYTWNIFFNKSFTFPNYNWYKGSWINGERDGTGILNFGNESGAKLAGTWQKNLKHGPGVIICGNGLTLHRNPLFEDDKPVHLSHDKIKAIEDHEEKPIETDAVQPAFTTFKQISKQIESKVAIKEFNSEILENITQSGLSLSRVECLKLYDKVSSDTKLSCPMVIPIHTVAEDVDLTYYIDLIGEHFQKTYGTQVGAERRQEGSVCLGSMSDIRENKKNNESNVQISSKSTLALKESEYKFEKTKEKSTLKNIITIFLPQLNHVYDTYATFAAGKEVQFKPLLVRLFLWQLYRDLEIPDQGLSLVETDLFLAKNPDSCVESSHYPFEPIYFWQFVQSLVGCSWLLYLAREKEDNPKPNTGVVAHIFKEFLENVVLPNTGKFRGSAITEFRDLLPIKSVYGLYLQVGEPHRVRDFLYYTTTKRGTDPPCFAALTGEVKCNMMLEGSNVVPLVHNISYMDVSDDTPIVPRQLTPLEEDEDRFSKTLYTFRNLGRKKIIKCISYICPRVYTAEGKVDMNYQLSFLEFHELILLLAYEKADRERMIRKQLYQVARQSKQSIPAFVDAVTKKPKKK